MALWREALDDLLQAATSAPNCAALCYRIGLCLERLAKPDEALPYYDRAVELQPHCTAYLYARAQLRTALHDSDGALADFAAAHDIAPATFKSILPPHTPDRPELIDLSGVFNTTLMPPNSSSPWPSLRLDSLPAGLQHLGGVPFDLRAAVQLGSTETSSRGGLFPRAALGIPVRQRARRLHILHTAHFIAPEGTDMAALILFFREGAPETTPLRYGEHAREYWRRCSSPVKGSLQVGGVPKEQNAQNLFLTTWKNPSPDQEILFVHFVSSGRQSAPCLLALTLDTATPDPSQNRPM